MVFAFPVLTISFTEQGGSALETDDWDDRYPYIPELLCRTKIGDIVSIVRFKEEQNHGTQMAVKYSLWSIKAGLSRHHGLHHDLFFLLSH